MVPASPTLTTAAQFSTASSAPRVALPKVSCWARDTQRLYYHPLAVFPAISHYWAKENFHPSVTTKGKGLASKMTVLPLQAAGLFIAKPGIPNISSHSEVAHRKGPSLLQVRNKPCIRFSWASRSRRLLHTNAFVNRFGVPAVKLKKPWQATAGLPDVWTHHTPHV